MPAPTVSALFGEKADALAAFRETLAVGVMGTYLSGVQLSDDYLWGKLLAAEADASHQLRVFFRPTKVLPDIAPQAEVDALEEAGTPYHQEGAYDYDPDFFSSERWGFISTHEKPVIEVESIQFVYPTQGYSVFTVPKEWVRVDRKYGQITLMPLSTVGVTAASMTLMHRMGSGVRVPMMMQLRYTAGLKDPSAQYPELPDLVKKMATLRLLQDAMLPQSGSISGDGLSESVSVDIDKFHDGINDKLDALREVIHGVRMTVL